MKTISMKALMLAATVLGVSATASAAAVKIVSSDPANGATVEKLGQINCKTDVQEWTTIDFNTYDVTQAPVYDKNRNVVAYVGLENGEGGEDLIMTMRQPTPTAWGSYPETEITAPGVYTFTIPANSFGDEYPAYSGNMVDGNEAVTFTFTIGGGEEPVTPPAGGGVTILSSEPANGATVSVLDKINAKTSAQEYTRVVDGYEYTDITMYDADNKAVAYVDLANGEDIDDLEIKFHTVEGKESYGTIFYPLIEIKEAGTYTFTLPAGTIGDEDPSTWQMINANEAPIKFTFTVDGSQGGGSEQPGGEVTAKVLKLTDATPADGSDVETLSDLDLYFDMEIGAPDYSEVKVRKESAKGEVVCGVSERDIDWFNAKHAEISLDKEITEAGTYVVCFPAGTFFNEDDMANPAKSDNIVLTYHVTGKQGGGDVEPFTATKLYPQDGATLKCDDGYELSPINVTFPYNVELVNADSKPVLKCNDGKEYVGSYNTSFQSMEKGCVICFDFFGTLTNEEIPSGVYTLTIPAGTFRKQGGSDVNEEITATYTWVQSSNFGAGNEEEDKEPLELVEFKLVKANGEEVNMLTEPSLSGFGRDAKFYILTNKANDEKLQALEIELYDETNSEEVLWHPWTFETGVTATRTDIHNGKNADGYFVFDYNQYDEFLAGHTYIMNVRAWNKFDNIAEGMRVARGEAALAFTGAAEAYEVADIDILSITPAPNSVLESEDQNVFVIEYSHPVEIIKFNKAGAQLTGSNHGTSGWVSFTSIVPNADKTVWTLTLPKSELAGSTAGFDLGIAAQSLDGKRVWRESYTQSGIDNQGNKESINQGIHYNCFLGGTPVKVTPAAGSTVEKLYSFKFESTGSGVKANIDYNYGVDPYTYKTFIPELRTMSGAVVAKMVRDENEIVNEYSQSTTDQISLSVTMHLDKEITAPGKYILYIPWASFIMGTEYSSEMNGTMHVEYIIGGDLDVTAASVKENSNVKELGLVSMYYGNDVTLAEDAKMVLRRKGATRVVKEAPLMVVKCATHTRVDADFSDAANTFAPYVLDAGEEGQAYELVVANGAVIDASGAPYVEKVIGFNCPAGDVVETVALTHEVAGHISSVSNVVKGQTAEVNLTPAEGWSLDTLKLNGADVTADVNGNVYTTPALNEDAALVASYKYEGAVEFTSGVLELAGTNLTIQVVDGKIIVGGLNNGDVVNVYTVGGSHVAQHNTTVETLAISLAKGQYIVTVNGKNAVKVML